MNQKKIKNLIYNIINENRYLILLLIIQIGISAKLTIFFLNKTSLSFSLFVQMFAQKISESSRELILIPITNNIIKNLKFELVKLNLFNDSKESIYVGFSKLQNIKIILTGINNLIYSIILLVALLKFNIKWILFIIFYICLVYIFEKFILVKRRIAWHSTSQNCDDVFDDLSKVDLITQGTITPSNETVKNEAEKWVNFGYSINLIKLFFIFFMCICIYIAPIYAKIFYQIWMITIQFFIISGYFDDFIQTINIKLKKENLFKENKNRIKIKNLRIFNIGPFDLEESSDCIILNSNNASGKTLLAKSIANLVEYDGYIESPKSFYLGLESSKSDKNSKGESIINTISLALEKDYSLFILDEVLDILSKENREKILLILSKKRLFIITHFNMELNRKFEKYTIKNNKLIKEKL